MSVTPFPNELGRFFVTSDTSDNTYVVDLQFQEEPWMKPKPLCGCIRGLGYGEYCKHLVACVDYERKRLNL